MDRLRVGYVFLAGIKRHLVYASGTGFGLRVRTPYAGDGSDGPAMGGLISVIGLADHPPLQSGPAVVDFLSGIDLGAITALFDRPEPTGPKVEVAMQGAAYPTRPRSLKPFATGKVPRRTANASHGRVPINVYPTNDGYIAMNLAVEEHWHSLLKPRAARICATTQVQLPSRG